MKDEPLEKERIKRLTRRHDVITIFPISVLFFATVYLYISRNVSADEEAQREQPGVHPSPVYLWLCYGAALYAAFDIVYIVVVPSVTKRYWQMIWHHIATLVMAYIALASDTECMTPCPLLVELNTLILTIQKVYKIKWLTIPMLITWATLRLIWYPILTSISFKYYSHPRFDAGYYWWLQAACFAVLNGLNVYWSAEFALPKDGQGFMKRKDA